MKITLENYDDLLCIEQMRHMGIGADLKSHEITCDEYFEEVSRRYNMAKEGKMPQPDENDERYQYFLKMSRGEPIR